MRLSRQEFARKYDYALDIHLMSEVFPQFHDAVVVYTNELTLKIVTVVFPVGRKNYVYAWNSVDDPEGDFQEKFDKAVLAMSCADPMDIRDALLDQGFMELENEETEF